MPSQLKETIHDQDRRETAAVVYTSYAYVCLLGTKALGEAYVTGKRRRNYSFCLG